MYYPEDSRLLQICVSEDKQKMGIGRKLVSFLENRVKSEDGDSREVTLHSRDYAVEFYKRLGYECYGDPFEEVGIPHVHMRKRV